MNYYFTGMLIVLFVLLAFMQPAYPRNEYLNSYGGECRYGEVDLSVSKGNRDSSNYSSSPYSHEESDDRISLSFRKFLGISKKDCDRKNEIAVENANKSNPIETIYFPHSPKKLRVNALAVSGALCNNDFPVNTTSDSPIFAFPFITFTVPVYGFSSYSTLISSAIDLA